MIRGIGLRGAVAVNVITMIGIGPLITIPLVLANLAGSLALIGWIAGALVALCDGLVWAELGSRFPGSGGTYVYLRETFGRDKLGRLLAFLFNWQFLLFAPFLLASGYIGFSNYAQYFWPNATPVQTHALAIGVGIVTTLALLRPIHNIARFGQILGCASIGTLLLVIIAAAPHVSLHQAFTIPAGTQFGLGFIAGLGGALYITLYDYVGYSDAALLGDEVREPRKTVPLAIVISILLVALLYISLQIAVLGSVSWHSLINSNGTPTLAGQYVASTIVEQSWGRAGGIIVTLLVLVTAFASVYGNLLGFSRIPFAAARDGVFLAPFAKLHPRSHFPYVSLLSIGTASLVASLFTLDFVIQVLTAGIVLIQSVAQIIALAVLRMRGGSGGFRMWLYPVPAVIAFAGWLYAFYSTGGVAIALGIGWLAIGTVVFLLLARRRRFWPFAALLLLAGIFQSWASAATWGGSAVVQSAGIPVFTVGGKPFFVYGASFFYERLPREEWHDALAAYKKLGINTIDLYVPWNWHELADGDFDFTGRTNSSRDLVGLLREVHGLGYKIILRPGPVIRNEWRNGGYPAWLLKRPEYNMPLHDVLEGRYPATATLQNAHSDDAAAEWMRNKTHMRYSARWLEHVLKLVAPYGGDVIAIALDDDQGAYIDNQTWPAPHFQAYMRHLKSVVQSVTGTHVPIFINTYQMKVTASAPVWAWGNWYQSDAYSVGEHDRTQLEFSTALLQTQPHLPVMVSEFQAGWLQNADEGYPRPADPTNTTLALHTMLQMGAHGVVNFPVQDTFNPPGWEAPWANAFYAWDAAFHAAPLFPNFRSRPTATFGNQVTTFGSLLATTEPDAHIAIAWTTSASRTAPSNDRIAALASNVQRQQQYCRAAHVACAIVDLRYAEPARLRRFDYLVVPARLRDPEPQTARMLSAFRKTGGHVVTSFRQIPLEKFAIPIADAVVLHDEANNIVFLDVVNYGYNKRIVAAAVVTVGGRSYSLPSITIGARDAQLLPLRIPLGGFDPSLAGGFLSASCPISGHYHGSAGTLTVRPLVTTTCEIQTVFGNTVRTATVGAGGELRITNGMLAAAKPTYESYIVPGPRCKHEPIIEFVPGGQTICFNTVTTPILRTSKTMLSVSAKAGARSFVLADIEAHFNAFSSVGGLRDDVAVQPPVSPRDYIGRYTHPIPAGMFNRPYVERRLPDGSMQFTYDAPDVLPHGARFDRIVRVDSALDAFDVDENVTFHGKNVPPAQAYIMRSSFAESDATVTLNVKNAFGFWNSRTHRIAMVAWPSRDVTAHTSELHPGNYIVSLTFAPGGWRRSVYALHDAQTLEAARQELATFAAAVDRQQGRGLPDANRA